jgi:hypothetical protein
LTIVEPSQRPAPLTALTDSTSAWRICVPLTSVPFDILGVTKGDANRRYPHGAAISVGTAWDKHLAREPVVGPIQESLQHLFGGASVPA